MKARTAHEDCIGGGGWWTENGRGRWLFAWGIAVAAGLGWPANADPVQLRPAQALQDGGAILLPGNPGQGYAIPCVADWNGDGKKDLLVGFQNLGEIALYLNLGTDAYPCFTNFTVLKTADGQIIQHTSSGCGSPAPWVCDFDGDGQQDLLVGDGATGKVWFYRNTNSTPNATPTLAQGVPLQVGTSTGTTDLTVGARATPYVCDWDEDGLPDLLCGDINGYVWFFRNTNTVQAPLFAPGVKLQAGGTTLCLAGSLGGVGRSVVRVFDWDGDGLKDLVCSSDGGVYWCRNTNSNSNPILQAPVPICAPTTNGLVPIVTGQRMRLDLVDWNNDGVVDLILGNKDGTVYYYEGYRFAFTSIARQPDGQLVLQWNSATNLKYNVFATNACPVNLLCYPAVTNLPSGGNTTVWTNPMQGRQQFFQIQIAQ